MGGSDDKRGSDSAAQKNEKVLHARIPGSLDREIKRRARGLGMSVSTVVRNVLLHTFDLVEDIVTDSANLAFSMTGDGEGAPPQPAAERAGHGADILGWQEAVLNLNAVCERCNAVLPKGTNAAIAIRAAAGPPSFICTTCLGALRDTEDET